jgi:XTP/dITP diphosphohydrolase
VHRNWEQIKAEEKGRRGVFEGIPATLPALARAQKMLGRLERSAGPDAATRFAASANGDPVAAALLEAVSLAAAEGRDAEGVLRDALRTLTGTEAGAEAATGSPE